MRYPSHEPEASLSATDQVSIRNALEADLPQVTKLLKDSGLTTEGLEEHRDNLFVASSDAAVVGCGALEPYGDASLLRSVAVQASRRGLGLGKKLTLHALDKAREAGSHDVYLLTETAADFFTNLGFRPVDRDAVPDAVKQSVEFIHICSESAVAMVHSVDA